MQGPGAPSEREAGSLQVGTGGEWGWGAGSIWEDRQQLPISQGGASVNSTAAFFHGEHLPVGRGDLHFPPGM